jgi:hypothetical protein
MASLQAKPIGKPDYVPPPIEGDFYRIAAVLNENERALLKRVREFTEGEIAPVIEDYWSRDAFPFEIIPKMAELGIGGIGYQGYGAAGGSWLLNGFVAMELARVDASVATFWGVHTGLSAGSIYLCGDEEHDAFRDDRLVRPDGAPGRVGYIGWDDDDLPSRGRQLDPQRPEEMDRQRHLRRHQRDLGARGGLESGQGLRHGKG